VLVSQISFISSKGTSDLSLLFLSGRPRGAGVLDTGLRTTDVRQACSSAGGCRRLEKNSFLYFLGLDRVVRCACKHHSQIFRQCDLVNVNLHLWHVGFSQFDDVR
jgi:hypothetical protein